MPNIVFEKIDENAVIPTYATPGSAGFDLYSVETVHVPYNRAQALEDILPIKVRLGFKTAIPEGYQVEIRSRSGLATKGLFVVNSPGTIDSDYRGEWMVLLGNITNRTIKLDAGTRVAQGVLMPVVQANFVDGQLDETERGEGGFGSTGEK